MWIYIYTHTEAAEHNSTLNMAIHQENLKWIAGWTQGLHISGHLRPAPV